METKQKSYKLYAYCEDCQRTVIQFYNNEEIKRYRCPYCFSHIDKNKWTIECYITPIKKE